MKVIVPSEEERFDARRPFAGIDIALFFQKELRALVEKYGYSEEEYRLFLSWHQPKDLVEKILDPNRFFRIIRDTEGKIVGFFESRTTIEDEKQLEIVQWIFLDPSLRGRGMSKDLWNDFFEYCKKKGVQQVRSFAKASNNLSCQMHESLGFKSDETDGAVTFTKTL